MAATDSSRFFYGKSMGWVDEECEKYGEASQRVRQWVDHYIELWGKDE